MRNQFIAAMLATTLTACGRPPAPTPIPLEGKDMDSAITSLLFQNRHHPENLEGTIHPVGDKTVSIRNIYKEQVPDLPRGMGQVCAEYKYKGTDISSGQSADFSSRTCKPEFLPPLEIQLSLSPEQN